MELSSRILSSNHFTIVASFALITVTSLEFALTASLNVQRKKHSRPVLVGQLRTFYGLCLWQLRTAMTHWCFDTLAVKKS